MAEIKNYNNDILESGIAKEILEQSFEGVIIASGPEHLINYVNSTWEKTTGYSKEEIVGKHNPRILKSGKMTPEFYKEMWSTILGGRLFRGEIINKRKDGTLYDAEVNIFPLKTKSGETIFVEISRDITQQKHLQKELSKYTQELEETVEERTKELSAKIKETEDATKAMLNLIEDLDIEKEAAEQAKIKFETLLTNVGHGLIVVDNDLKTVFVNKAAADLLHLDEKRDLGRFYFDLWDLEDERGRLLQPDEMPVTKAIKSGERISSSEYSYVRKSDGKKIPVAVTVAPFSGNKLGGAIVTFRDIAEEKKIDRAKSEFVSLASHQLRTPLTVVKWYSEMLLENSLGLSDTQKNYLREINNGTERMAALINAILNVSRIELGTFALETKPVNLADAVLSALQPYAKKIDEKKIKFEKILGKDLPQTIYCDLNLLKITLDNLISNAIEYTQNESEVNLKISKEGDNILITVKDNGYGIPKDEQDKIFTRFYRAQNIRDKVPTGTGLGLYVLKSLLERVGGKIRFESEGENKGAIFFVIIPIKPPDDEVTANHN